MSPPEPLSAASLFAGSQMEATIARAAAGNWDAWPPARLPDIYRAAEHWAAQVSSIDKPWLCWCVSDPWCILQQRLVLSVGWTPIVGHDTNIAQPTVLPGSIAVNFNADLQLPRLLMYFVLEWVFLFAPRLTFWHVDMLLSHRDMATAARTFEDLAQGQMALPHCRANPLLRWLAPYRPISIDNRLFEVIGCNTREASRQQYEEGLGFWRHPECHPNNTTLPADFPHWEHTIGVSLWARRHPTQHIVPKVDIKTGHAATWKFRGLGRTMSKQELLEEHANIRHYAEKLGIVDLLEAA